MLLQLLDGIEQYPIHEQIIGYILVYSILIGYVCAFIGLICTFVNFIRKS